MGTVADKLSYLNDTKTAIKDAIVAKGVDVADTDTFRSYATKIGEIQAGGGGAPATKFGVSIDDFIGSVDADGKYIAPGADKETTLDLTGVKRMPGSGFAYKLYLSVSNITVLAPDLTKVESEAFKHAFFGATKYTARFDKLEQITAASAFEAAFAGGVYGNPEFDIVFPALKIINGNYVFRDCFDDSIDLGKVFPVLEEIKGNMIFRNLRTGYTHTFASVKKIIGVSSKYNAPFYMNYIGVININLPSATELSNYVCYTSSSYKCNLHFAVANQAAIEACAGYEYKFGATEIYFDL
jgi:hypothetical protein